VSGQGVLAFDAADPNPGEAILRRVIDTEDLSFLDRIAASPAETRAAAAKVKALKAARSATFGRRVWRK